MSAGTTADTVDKPAILGVTLEVTVVISTPGEEPIAERFTTSLTAGGAAAGPERAAEISRRFTSSLSRAIDAWKARPRS